LEDKAARALAFEFCREAGERLLTAWFLGRAFAGSGIRFARRARERGSIAAPLHNRNRGSEGLKIPPQAAFLPQACNAIMSVVNNQD
jgi:hypothetical protein